MKIAFFNYLPLEYGGGVAKHIYDTSRGLKKRFPGLEISIVTFNESVSKSIMKLYSLYYFRNVEKDFKKIQKGESFQKRLQDVSYYKAKNLSDLRNFLESCDVVYSKNDLLEAAILKLLIGYKNLKSVIFIFHSPVKYDVVNFSHLRLHNFLYKSHLYTYVLSGAKKLHVLNEFDKNLLSKRFPKKTVEKIYNPFDFDGFVKKASKYKNRLKWKKNKFNILWVGRLTREKGAEDLVTLINSINRTKYKKNIVWNIAGEGEYKKQIKYLKRKWNNVNYLGHLKSDYMPSVYKECDLFLSTSKFETLPYTFLEAQSFGLPIVSYNIHGCNDIITNGKNGYLISSLGGIKKQIIKLLVQPGFKKTKIKLHIRKRFNQELIYKQLFNLLTN